MKCKNYVDLRNEIEWTEERFSEYLSLNNKCQFPYCTSADEQLALLVSKVQEQYNYYQEQCNYYQEKIDSVLKTADDILKTFRIKAKNIPANKSPPLNVEFHHVSDRNTDPRNKLLDQNTRDKLEKLEENAKFYGVKCFPDRTYYQWKKYSILKTEMNNRNQCLIYKQ